MPGIGCPGRCVNFTAASEVRATHPKADAGDEATNTGATGVQPSFGTTLRFGRGIALVLAAAAGSL
jgi:hypothetical protein